MSDAGTPPEPTEPAPDLNFAAPSQPGFGAAPQGYAPAAPAAPVPQGYAAAPQGYAPATPGYAPAPQGRGYPPAPGYAPVQPGTQPGAPRVTWSDAASGYVAAPGTIAGGSRTGTATLTLIFGLLGLIGGIVFGWGFPFAIAALVLAPRALRGDPAGHARARRGRTLALVGLVATVVWFGYSVLRFIDLLLN